MKKDLPACPVEITMGLIGEKWKVLIIRDLLTGTKRFGELRKSVTGITQKVLTNNLRQMEASGLVKRKVYAENYKRQEKILNDTLEKKLNEYNALMNNYASLINKKIDLIHQINKSIEELQGQAFSYEQKVKLLKFLIDLKSKTLEEVNTLNLLEEKIAHSITLYKRG